MKRLKTLALIGSLIVVILNASCISTPVFLATGSTETGQKVSKRIANIELFPVYAGYMGSLYVESGMRLFAKTNAAAHLSIHVEDQYGNSIKNVHCTGVLKRKMKRALGDIILDGYTDLNGDLVIQSKIETDGWYHLYKDGYHTVSCFLDYPDSLKFNDEGNKIFAQFDIQDTVVMSRHVNPVAGLYVDVEIDTRKISLPCGFDLVKGDWVSAGKKGEIIDCIFSLTDRNTLTMTFVDSGDGVIKATVKNISKTFFAPAEGYKTEDSCIIRGDFFRIRTSRMSGCYGKFAYVFYLPEIQRLRFGYCINPDGSRNLEFIPSLFFSPEQWDIYFKPDRSRNLEPIELRE